MRPNVLFIMTDQQRYETLAPTGHSRFPNMEKLRDESVAFSNYYISAAACVASRACLLSGRNAWDLHVHGNLRLRMDESQCGPLERSWMQVLRDHGYASVSVGKTHMIHAGSYHIPVPLGDSFGPQDGWDHFHPMASPQPDATFFDMHVASRTCDALERLADRGPFAMFVGFHAPHEPYVMPEKYLDSFKAADMELPKNRSMEEYEEKSASYRRRIQHFKSMFGNCIHDDEAIRRAMAGYYSSLKMVDDCVGVIMEKVQSLGLDDNTLVIFTSDHGEMLGEHYLFNKNATGYEAEIHVPFLMRFPGRQNAGKIVSQWGCGIDFYPTLMELLEIDPDLPLPGYSLVPAIQKGDEVRDEVLIWHSVSSLTLLCRDAKLTYCPEDGDGELYDLKKDPDEMHNLWNEPGAAELKHKMVQKMLHARLYSDKRASRMTEREMRLHDEVFASKEPEVVGITIS